MTTDAGSVRRLVSGTAVAGVPLLVLAATWAIQVVSGQTGLPEHPIEIVSDPRPYSPAKIDLGRNFGTTPCSSRRSGKTILEVLLPDAKRILIHQYDKRDWRDLETVKGYIRRLLSAEPEGGMLSAAVYWAELRPAEILASVEFSKGQRRPLQLANGYAHVQDVSGCEWWARYLGPDRSKWVVRP